MGSGAILPLLHIIIVSNLLVRHPNRSDIVMRFPCADDCTLLIQRARHPQARLGMSNPGGEPPPDHIHAVQEVALDATNGDSSEEELPLLPDGAPGTDKLIYLIRHGQSEYNIHEETYGTDPMVFDADLTPLGVQQATSLRERVASLGIELAITTPLRRAVRTCLLSLPFEENKDKVKYEVWAQPRELLEASCDLGSPLSYLESEFPVLNFRTLPPVWWFVSEDCRPGDVEHSHTIFREQGFVEPYDVFKARVDELALMLRQREERVIAVYGHGDFFHCFLREHMGIKGKWMHNCEVVGGRIRR